MFMSGWGRSKPERVVDRSISSMGMPTPLLEMERHFKRLSTRSVFLRDRLLGERNDWLAEIYGTLDQFRYFEHSTAPFSAAREAYDVFIGHGDDAPRLAKMLRRNRAILAGKVKVALMAQRAPGDRALLLTAGYDVVVDCRMPRAEYVARITAIHVRSYRHAPSVIGPLEDLRVVLRKYVADNVGMNTLTENELLLLTRLAARKNLSVHCHELQRSATGHIPTRNRKSLCVAISRLRRKLAPAYRIVSDYMDGYVLADAVVPTAASTRCSALPVTG